MIIFDYILIMILLGFVYYGYRSGLLQSIGVLLGLIVGMAIASRFFESVGDLLGGSNFSKVLAFIVLFAVITKVVGWLFKMVGKVFKVITVLPIISQIESLLGAIFGAAEGIVFLAVLLFFLVKFPVNDWLATSIETSALAAVLLQIGAIFVPLFPQAIQKLEEIVESD